MDQICLVVPILPGRTADARDFMRELGTEHSTGYQRSEQRMGIVKEAWYLAPAPAGDHLAAYLESPDFPAALSALSQSQDEFDRWFRQRLVDATGVDLSTPPTAHFASFCSAIRPTTGSDRPPQIRRDRAGHARSAGIARPEPRRYTRITSIGGDQMMFLDCPAYLGEDGERRCGLPAEVRRRFTMRSSGGPVEAAMIRCPAGHWFNGPIESLTWDSKAMHQPGKTGAASSVTHHSRE